MTLLILSDIHANWPALQAVLHAEPGADQILCLGDLVIFLAKLSPSKRFRLDGANCLACHAIPSEPLYGYLAERSALSLWESELDLAGHIPTSSCSATLTCR